MTAATGACDLSVWPQTVTLSSVPWLDLSVWPLTVTFSSVPRLDLSKGLKFLDLSVWPRTVVNADTAVVLS